MDITLTEGMKWSLGVLIDSNIDENSQKLGAQFTSGEAEDDVEQTISTGIAVYSFTTSTPDASPGEESRVEHHKEKEDKSPNQSAFLNTFDVLLIIITAVIVQMIILRGKRKS